MNLFHRFAIVGALIVSGCVAGLAVLFLFDPALNSFYPGCMFHRVTGLNCPGCGSLRAMHQLLHGHLSAAFRFNPLLVISLPVAGYFFLQYILRRAMKRPAVAIRLFHIWLLAGSIVAFGILRNVPWPALAWVSP